MPRPQKQRFVREGFPQSIELDCLLDRRAVALFKHCCDTNQPLNTAIRSVYLQGLLDGADVEGRRRDRELAYFGA